MGAFTIMTADGQITIPSEVRDALNLEPGTKFYITARDGQIVVIAKNKKLADFAGILGKPPNGKNLSIEEMKEAIADAVAEDDLRITREWLESDR
jgi:antitoxin PrlF